MDPRSYLHVYLACTINLLEWNSFELRFNFFQEQIY